LKDIPAKDEDKPELAADGKPKPPPPSDDEKAEKADKDKAEKPDMSDKPELASDGKPKPPPPDDVQQKEAAAEPAQDEDEYNGLLDISSGYEGMDVGEAAAEEPKDKPEPKEAKPDKPEPKEAPEAKAAPEGKAAVEEDDEAEVVWPEDPSEGETVYGLPDYSKVGYEGEDVAEAEAAQDEDDYNTLPDYSSGNEEEEQEKPDLSDTEPEKETEAKAVDIDSVLTEISMYYLISGYGLYTQDTSELAHPYAPSVAKPFHIVDEFSVDDEHTFYTQIFNRPQSADLKCIFGRDGTANDFTEFSIDNTVCDNRQVMLQGMLESQQLKQQKQKQQFQQGMTFSSSGEGFNMRSSLIWSLAMVGVLVVVVVVLALFSRCSRRGIMSTKQGLVTRSVPDYGTYRQ